MPQQFYQAIIWKKEDYQIAKDNNLFHYCSAAFFLFWFFTVMSFCLGFSDYNVCVSTGTLVSVELHVIFLLMLIMYFFILFEEPFYIQE